MAVMLVISDNLVYDQGVNLLFFGGSVYQNQRFPLFFPQKA
jgi:hypothetical protein